MTELLFKSGSGWIFKFSVNDSAASKYTLEGGDDFEEALSDDDDFGEVMGDDEAAMMELGGCASRNIGQWGHTRYRKADDAET